MDKGDFNGLLFELPDFVEGKITDDILRGKIISLIDEDIDFRIEYELLKNSLSSIRKTEIESPGNEYFSNLTLKINKKIDENKNTISIFEKYRALIINWKFATVFSVLLITVIFYKSGLINREGSKYFNEKISEIAENRNSTVPVDTSENIIDEEDYEFVDIDDEKISSTNKGKNQTVKYQNKNNKKNNNSDFSADDFGETQLYFNAENLSIEDEFEKMTPVQQKEFLKNLENLKL